MILRIGNYCHYFPLYCTYCAKNEYLSCLCRLDRPYSPFVFSHFPFRNFEANSEALVKRGATSKSIENTTSTASIFSQKVFLRFCLKISRSRYGVLFAVFFCTVCYSEFSSHSLPAIIYSKSRLSFLSPSHMSKSLFKSLRKPISQAAAGLRSIQNVYPGSPTPSPIGTVNTFSTLSYGS